MNLRDTKVQIAILLVLAVIAGTYFWYTSLYRPLLDQLGEKSEEYQLLKTRLEMAKRQAARRVSLQQEYEDLQEQWKVVETLLPKERDMSDFIQQIHRIKGKVDATVERISPLKSRSLDFLVENPYEMEMLTTYHGLGKFLSHVANLPIIVDVTLQDVTGIPQVEEEEEEEKQVLGPSIRSRLVLSTYSIKEEVNLEEEEEK